MTPIRAVAHTNIALIKYWGKNKGDGNLPAVGSLSLTLDQFYTTTLVEPNEQDVFELDGKKATQEAVRVFAHVDWFRKLTGNAQKFKICSFNEVPTASGLASSASAFAALTMGLAQAFGLDFSRQELSRIARRGSGSAARSLFSGFALMHGGPHISDEGAFAEPIQTPLSESLAMIVLECAIKPKDIGSRDAMKRVTETSIFYEAFRAQHPRLLESAVSALRSGDLEQLGRLMENSTLQMHATMLGCSEPFWYFNAATMAALSEVTSLRRSGHLCYFTMDAGPHVKVLCHLHAAESLRERLARVEGVARATICRAGPGAYLS